MKVLIVDDEPLARARIKRLLLQQPSYEYVGEAGDAVQALQLAKQLKPDLMLIDIEMPNTDGISLACQLDGLSKVPAVIFVTAHAEHALEAYRAAPLDYILKPVSAERLFEALLRVKGKVIASSKPAKLSYTIGTVTKQLVVAEILYCTADDKYVRVITTSTEAIIDQSLNQLQQVLPAQFIRSHRNTLINLDYFQSLHTAVDGKIYIKLQGVDNKLNVSRRALANVKQALKLI